MATKKVLLVFPGYEGRDMGALHPPLGIGYLAEALRRNEIPYNVLDLRPGYKTSDLLKKIEVFRPDIVGFSIMSLMHKQTFKIIEEVKQVWPELTTIAGGPHITTLRHQALIECQSLNFGIVYEGEESLVEFCQGKPAAEIRGLLYRSNGNVNYTGDRDFVDINSIPFPRYAGFELNKYITREIGILTSRGCPFTCTYCPVKTVIGRKYRWRSPENVVDEMEYWYEQGYRQFDIIDDVFNLRKDRVYAICDAIEKRGLKNLVIKCGNGIRADCADKPMLKRMYEVGFRFLAFGVESGSDKVLRNLKRGGQAVKSEVVRQAVKDACDLGYEVTLFFIVGSPGETWQDIEASAEFAHSHPVFDARFYNLIPFPGTELFDWVRENNYFCMQPEVYLNEASHFDNVPLFETPDLSYAERQKALLYLRKVRKIVRRRAMERRLKIRGARHILARIYTMDYVQGKLLKRRLFRMAARRAYDALIKLS